jgi:hypothetical protein
MTQADDRLKALFAQDEPAAQDPAFSAAVMERLMRRRFQEDMALLGVASVAGGGVLWAVWPSLQEALTSISQGLGATVVALAVAACAVMILGGRPSSVLGLES